MDVTVQFTVSEVVLAAVGVARSAAGIAVKQELAVSYFQRGALTFGQARSLAGGTVWDFLDLLRERKVSLHYDLREYEEDAETAKELL